MTALRYPDFICIGAQKAGTTWLHQRMGQHPEIWLPPLKEIHYFDSLYLGRRSDPILVSQRAEAALRAARRALERDEEPDAKLARLYVLALIGRPRLEDDWYGRIFESAGPEQICGEITPAYALLPEAGIEHMARLNARMKILFVLRDPIERAWSELRMLQKRSDGGDTNVRHVIARRGFLNYSDYLSTVTRYRKVFSEDQFHIIFFDDIEERPEQAMASVCEFLGLPFDPANFRGLERAVHKGIEQKIKPEIYELLRERLRSTYEQLSSLDSPCVRDWQRKHYSAD